MNPSLKFLLALVVAFLVLAAPAVAAPRTEAPDLACVHGGTGGIGHSPFHCWCLEWAHTNTTRFRICRVIAWSDGRETALPPHEYAPRSFGPEPSPQARRAHHKAHYVKRERAYTYWTIVDVWDEAGNHTTVPALCRVKPRHETLCQIAVPL